MTGIVKRLDESVVPKEVAALQKYLTKRVVGQARAIKQFVRVHETWLAGMNPKNRPLGVFLFVGPTGSGKTHAAEAFAEHFWGTPDALIKINCGEFQAGHETAKLTGAPPGYVGYGEANAQITKERLEKYWVRDFPKFSMILFDEIEKAHRDFHQILLGINDRGQMRTGKGTEVDLRNTIIVMTSNLGVREVGKHLTNSSYGFNEKPKQNDNLEDEIYKSTRDAVKKFFAPEFFNRIDRIVCFGSLNDAMLREILDLELQLIQDRIILANHFASIDVSSRAKDFLIKEGTSKEYGARELRRAIERFLVPRITRGLATKQIGNGDCVLIDVENNKFTVDIQKGAMVVPPQKVIPPAHVTSQVPTERGSKPLRVEPTNSNFDYPFESLAHPGYCGRCGFPWGGKHEKHECVETDPDSEKKDKFLGEIAKLRAKFLKDQEDKRKKK